MEILPVGAEVFRMDGRTDLKERHEKANISFSQFCEST